LDCVDEEEAAMPPADFADGVEVRPITAQVLHEADRQQPGAKAGSVDFVQRIFH
jgi:hypothetical protein